MSAPNLFRADGMDDDGISTTLSRAFDPRSREVDLDRISAARPSQMEKPAIVTRGQSSADGSAAAMF